MNNKSNKWCFGDVHGNIKALEQVFERAPIEKGDTIISLGDIADGWMWTPDCVELLLSMKEDYNMIFLRGNHDVWAMNWLNTADAPQIWLTQGGKATRDAYIEQGKVGDQRHIDFFNNQLDYYIDEENRLFVHAGFDLTYGFEWSKTAQVGLPNALEIHWTRDCAEFNTKSWGKKAQAWLAEFKEIFIGHTAHNSVIFNTPEKLNIYNYDTGAGYMGKLTIANVETKEFYQSDRASLLYPGMRGR